MKAYKGFNKDMTCRGFQYEEGKTYETDQAKMCSSGFHACINPLDCFSYYAPGNSEYHEVEIEDNGERQSDDTKVVGKKITIGAKLSVSALCKLHFEYTKSQCTNHEQGKDKAYLSGGYKSSLAGGDESSLAGGNWSSLAGGDWSSLAGGNESSLAGGNWSSLAGGDESSLAGGYRSSLAGGDESSLAGGYKSSLAGGDESSLAGGNESSLAGGNESSLAGGNWSSLAGGDWSSLAGGDESSLAGGYRSSLAGGDKSSLAGRGSAEAKKNSSIIVRGNDVKAKGGLGTVIVIVEEQKNNYDIKDWKAAVVDGKDIKADTWYRLENGEFVEVAE